MKKSKHSARHADKLKDLSAKADPKGGFITKQVDVASPIFFQGCVSSPPPPPPPPPK